MQLFVRGAEDVHTIDVAESATVSELKSLVENLEQLTDADSYFLSLNGRIVDAEDTTLLTTLGFENLNTVDLTVRLVGGKVHGSLARAGKVRGQTPKVDKKEKRKKKTGRAKRRLQYTRRFVNVVATGPGRRRGPNSNMT